MLSSNTYFPRGKQESLYNGLPIDSNVFLEDVYVPKGFTKLALEVYNNGLGVNITDIYIYPRYHAAPSNVSNGRIVVVSSLSAGNGVQTYVSGHGNSQSPTINGLSLLTPGQRLRVWVAMSATPGTGTLQVTAHWSN